MSGRFIRSASSHHVLVPIFRQNRINVQSIGQSNPFLLVSIQLVMFDGTTAGAVPRRRAAG